MSSGKPMFRIIQSIPSPRAEPFKRWLAQVGYERVKEIENPELASARELYQAKGYPKDWIEKRLRSIAVRGELPDEWKARGVAEGKEYAILRNQLVALYFLRVPHKLSSLLPQPGNGPSCSAICDTPSQPPKRRCHDELRCRH